MSSFLKPFLKSGAKKGIPSFLQTGSNDLTDSEKELLPYLRAAREEQKTEAKEFSPLELITDLLNRGQYASANVGKELFSGNLSDIPEAAYKGLTGQRKGDWKTTLFGGQDEGDKEEYKGIIGEQESLKGKIPLLSDIPIVGESMFDTWEDVIGLAANIFLDPTTYMSWGVSSGASEAAKAAARAGAREVVKRSLLKVGNIDELAKIASKGFSREAYEQLAKKSLKQAEKYLTKHVTAKEMAKFNKKLFLSSYRDLLTTTGGDFTQKLAQGVLESKEEFAERAAKQMATGGRIPLLKRINGLIKNNPGTHDYLKHLQDLAKNKNITGEQIEQIYKNVFSYSAENGLTATKGMMENAISNYSHYAKEVERMASPEFAQNFAKMGERKAGDFFGHEWGKSIRKPSAPEMFVEKIRKSISDSKIGDFSRAVGDWVDSSKIGDLKRMLGIRNPYQKMLRQMEMDNHYLAEKLTTDAIDYVHDVFGGVDKEMKDKVVKIIDYGKEIGADGIPELLDDPRVLEIIGTTPVEDITKWLNAQKEMVDGFYKIELDLIDKGLMAGYTPRVNYLPRHNMQLVKKKGSKAIGSFTPGFAKHQKMTLKAIADQEAEYMAKFLGVDVQEAQKIASELGWSTVNRDLEEMMMYRAVAHARAVANADLVTKFRDFGAKIDLTTATPKMKAYFSRTGDNPMAGLRAIETDFPALKDVYFDEEVANIIDRVIPVTSSDRGLEAFKKVMNAVTTNFKSWATFSPGFDLRNMKSDITTGFINYGASFMNPARMRKSAMLAAYGVYGEKALRDPSGITGKIMKSAMGLSDREITKILGEVVNGKTLREWADIMREKGIISKASMGFDIEDTISKIGKKKTTFEKYSPTSNKNILFEKHRNLGGVRESTTRVQGFLTDLKKMAGDGAAPESMVDEAVRNVKKYFFDYEDLSEFEQKVLKKVIPFYSWIRKNIALQMNQLTESTSRIATVLKTTKAMGTDEVDREDLPEYVRQQGGIATDVENGIARIFFPDMPYKDINALPLTFTINENGIPIPNIKPEEAYYDFLSAAHPVFKTITTLTGEGFDPFRRRQLDSKAPAPRAFRVLGNNPELFAFIDSAFKSIGIKNGLGLEVDQDGKMQMDGKMAKLLEDNFIFLRRIDDLGGTLTAIFPQLDKALEDLTGTKDRYTDADRALKAMSFALGISEKEIDLEKQKGYDFKEALRRAEEARSLARKKAPGYQQRSDKYYQSYENRMRRLRSAS